MVARLKRPHGHHAKHGRLCSICTHENRVLIEAARISGISLDVVAAKYNCSADALGRHFSKGHVSPELRAQYVADVPLKELAAAAAAENTSLLGYLSLMRAALMSQFQTSIAHGDRHSTGVTGRILLDVLRAIGKLTGELLEASSVNITTVNHYNAFLNSPAFGDMIAMLQEALRPYPEALQAVLAGFDRLESENTEQPKLIELNPRGDDAAT